MLLWLKENISTIIVGAIVLAVLIAVVVNMVKKKKQGKSSCGCNCSCCPMGENCHSDIKPLNK